MILTFKKKKFGNDLAIIGLLVCSVLCGIFPQTVLSLAVVLLCGILLLRDELYLAYPFILFYNQFYGIVFGVSVHRIFSLMLLAVIVVRVYIEKSIKIKKDMVLPVLVYLLYAFFVVSQEGLGQMFFTIIDIMARVVLITFYFVNKKENLRNFFRIYVYVCFAAILTGFISNNVMSYGTLERFMATFEDPNYMGFFYTVAVFAVVTLNLFKKWTRRVVVVLLYVPIIMSLSMTAIVVNILLWVGYLLITKRITIKTVIISLICLFAVMQIYSYGVSHPDTPFLGDLSDRIQDTLDDFMLGDMSGVTTGRTRMTQEHFEYYSELPIMNTLFGGIPINTSYIHPDFKSTAHNEYVDMLLNVGVIGAIILIYYLVKNVIMFFRKFLITNEDYYLCMLMIKFTLILYMTSLTVFLDERFMFIYFL